MTDDAGKKKPRTWRGWLLRAVLWLLVLLAVGLVALWWQLESEASQGRKDLAAVVEALDESDPGWRWEEIEAGLAPIPDKENSALVLKQWKESLGKWGPGDIKLEKEDRPLGGIGGPPRPTLLLLDNRPPPNRRLDAQRLGRLREELGPREAAIALAVSLKGYPRGRAPIRLTDDVLGTQLPHVERAREAAYLLELDCERLLHGGRGAEVPDRVFAALNAGASLRDDPFFISALVRMAIRGVAVRCTERLLCLSEPTDEACRALSAAFTAERAEGLLLPTLRGERAGYNRLFSNLKAGKPPLARFLLAAADTKGEPGLMLWLGAAVYSYRLPDDHAFLLERYGELCDVARLPDEDQQAGWSAFDAQFRVSKQEAASSLRRILSHLLLPATTKVGEAALRDRAHLAAAITALAAERFRREMKQWPRSLKELAPKYVQELPPDPYTGKPLLYAKREGGVVIYSVGKDGIDGGGKVEPPPQGGVPEDIGMRLYDPERRGLPAEKQ